MPRSLAPVFTDPQLGGLYTQDGRKVGAGAPPDLTGQVRQPVEAVAGALVAGESAAPGSTTDTVARADAAAAACCYAK